jgi:hypothetical protein
MTTLTSDQVLTATDELIAVHEHLSPMPTPA